MPRFDTGGAARPITLTLGIAAVVALALGAIGLYGVLSYAVTLQTREIGVYRARRPTVPCQGGVMRTAAAITVIGLVIGTLGAVWLTRFLAGLLYETEPLDVPTFVVMSALLFAIRQFASYLPARKAASVSPLRPGEASSRFEVSLQALQPVYGGV